MTARQHLASFHKRAAAHYRRMSEHFGGLASRLGKADKSDMKDDDQQAVGDCEKILKAAAVEARDMADFHDGAFEECSKAEDSIQVPASGVTGFNRAAGDRIIPNFVSTVTPTAPQFQAVPRHGQPVPGAVAGAGGLTKGEINEIVGIGTYAHIEDTTVWSKQ